MPGVVAVRDPAAGRNPAIPIRVRRILQGGFIASSADRLIYGWRLRGRPHHVNPGGLAGDVIAYLWADDPDEAMVFLAGYLAELNLHHPDAGTYGKVALEELLDGPRPVHAAGLRRPRGALREGPPGRPGPLRLRDLTHVRPTAR